LAETQSRRETDRKLRSAVQHQKRRGRLRAPLVEWKSSYFFFFFAAFLVAFFLVAIVLFSLPFVMEYCDSNFHRNLLVV
jgi:Flp pilus assembly protein TadB